MKYLPYHMENLVWSQHFCEVSFNTVAPDFRLGRSGKFASGTPIDLIEFLKEHGKCSFCNALIDKNFEKCQCGMPRGKGCHLTVKYPTEIDTTFKKIFDREKTRLSSIKRNAMVQKNGGQFDKKHIPGLHAAQCGLCYYCGSPIELGSKNLHADHYQPIAASGRNDLNNIVLACARCNHLKNAKHGDEFDTYARRFRTPEFAVKRRTIRKNLVAYRSLHSSE